MSVQNVPRNYEAFWESLLSTLCIANNMKTQLNNKGKLILVIEWFGAMWVR